MPSTAKRQDWFTPLSDNGIAHFVSLLHQETLTIVFSIARSGKRIKYSLVWERFCAYRNTDEAQYVPCALEDLPSPSGCTNVIANSEWIASLRDENDLFDILEPGAKHYAIASFDYITEVISKDDPIITQIE